MISAKDVARYLIFAYEEQTGTQFERSELKLQKLLYLSQRESFCLTGKKLFKEDFEGWVHGPVITELRFFFDEGYAALKSLDDSKLNVNEMYIVNNVIAKYGMYEAWYLRDLTHEEISWKNSRIGLSGKNHGCKKLKLEDIEEDAKKIRAYDNIFDMYIDEFEDLTPEEKEYVNEQGKENLYSHF
ncbi:MULTISPECIES: Panacea domain-containing protein [Helcococcus]|uniref:Type II toxin-antitoxin system antitoxin SocA domain-containing protein n=1 Tax=Helcococcus bovis TaxID=3153252 RepID=A0ABW9F7N4_9FIRM